MADETCPICKFPFKHDEDIESSFRRCSEFCACATEKELKEFQVAKPGDFCVYPCPECSGPVEGEWIPNDPGCICYSCYPRVRIRNLLGLLTECLPHLPVELRARADKLLK